MQKITQKEITELLVAATAKFLNCGHNEIKIDVPIYELAVDSMQTMLLISELETALNKIIQIEIDYTILANCSTIEQLAKYILDQKKIG